jgi:Bifunctional DNA primase/polymerase, N-terminal
MADRPPGRQEGGPDTSPDRQQPRPTATATITDEALAYAERGWHVFPVKDGGKEPRAGWKWTRWNTRDPALIRQWWASGGNVGIACGPSGLVVIDLDTGGPLPPPWDTVPGVANGDDVYAVLDG